MTTPQDPMARLARDAEAQVVEAGIKGGDAHDEISQTVVIFAAWSWGLREIRKSNEDLAEKIVSRLSGNGTKKDAAMRMGIPAIGGGGIVAAVMVMLDKLANL